MANNTLEFNSKSYHNHFESLICHLWEKFPKEQNQGLSIYHSGGGHFHYHLTKDNFYMIINPVIDDDIGEVEELSSSTDQKVCCTFDDDDMKIQKSFEAKSLKEAIKEFHRLYKKHLVGVANDN